ncbi:unnamed protein product [Phaedon cochleariae]|uniref:SLC12A transporter C-terminal domain-containing protein n=1 Tax=Phaedon cochleariae TaxID=80249 RepID=A0A9N9SD57_PHACE|nr:unnamed protein product [Phaedon cochleariae]
MPPKELKILQDCEKIMTKKIVLVSIPGGNNTKMRNKLRFFDVNWGSSTQAQTYKTALTTAQRLNNIGEHVKTYKPQVLVLCGKPQERPPLVDFANLITKNHSLLVIGDIEDKPLTHRDRLTNTRKVYDYLRSNKIKAFYTIIDNVSFELGAKALLQTTGIGKLSPNVLMMGYKTDWMTCDKEELLAYFNVLQ